MHKCTYRICEVPFANLYKEKEVSTKGLRTQLRKCKGLMLYVQEALTNNNVVESVVNTQRT
jgi:hypothetical protein